MMVREPPSLRVRPCHSAPSTKRSPRGTTRVVDTSESCKRRPYRRAPRPELLLQSTVRPPQRLVATLLEQMHDLGARPDEGRQGQNEEPRGGPHRRF